jgi:predicted PurR-regulated permease PerM
MVEVTSRISLETKGLHCAGSAGNTFSSAPNSSPASNPNAENRTPNTEYRLPELMDLGQHARLTGGALKNWAVAQLQDSIAVGLLWWLGLYLLKVPWAPFWALLGAVLQIVPHIGPVLSLLGPVLAAWIHWGSLRYSLYVLMLYAVIVVVDGFLLQPYIMKRTARVPIWASIFTPIVLGVIFPFWGVLLSAPLLAVIYAYKEHHASLLRK